MEAEQPLRVLQEEFPAECLSAVGVPGLGALPCVAPHDLEGLQRVLELAHSLAWRLRVAGNGTRLASAPQPEHVDLVLSTRHWSGLSAFEPGDGTLSAKSGSSMQALERTAAEAGYALSPAVAHPARHTLGGILGAGVSGIDRLARGPLRHHVLGMRVLHADGSLSKTGGSLVKNVTGYDLQRLYTGSQGSLCLILEASLRLFPEPRQRAILRCPAVDRSAALEQALALWNERLSAEALITVPGSTGDGWETLVFLAGRPERVASELQRSLGNLEGSQALQGSEADALRSHWRDALELAPERVGFQVSTTPSRLGALLETLDAALRAQDLDHSLLLQAALASVQVELEGQPARARLNAVNQVLLDAGIVPRWQQAPAELLPAGYAAHGAAGVWMQRFKDALDPTSIFAGGA